MDAHSRHAAASHAAHINPYFLTAVGAASALTLAPYVLPLLGGGTWNDTSTIMHGIGGHAVLDAATGGLSSYGTGLAGALASGMARVPWVGHVLTSAAPVTVPGLGWSVTAGTLASLAAVACVGIGGVLLANWLEKHEAPNALLHWSRIIRYTALTTSALIALPSILSGISVGIAFLSFVIGGYGTAARSMMGLQGTIGATSMGGEAATGVLGIILPHLLTCGSALLPLLTGIFLGRHGSDDVAAPESKEMAANTTTVHVELVSVAPVTAGQKTSIAFRLIDAATGRALSPDELVTTHTQKLHTMIVDDSLTDYHHLHPSYDAASGLFTCSFTPQLQQRYGIWNDFTRQGEAMPTTLKTLLPSAANPKPSVMIYPSQSATAGGLHISIQTNQPLERGKTTQLAIGVTDTAGNPASLEPIMGAYAHLAGFSRDGTHFIHAHPTDTAAPADGQLHFHMAPDHAGLTKFFLQVKCDGHVVTIPFGQRVREAAPFAARLQANHSQSAAFAVMG